MTWAALYIVNTADSFNTADTLIFHPFSYDFRLKSLKFRMKLRMIPTIAESPEPLSEKLPAVKFAPPRPRTSIEAVIIRFSFCEIYLASTMFLPMDEIIPNRRIDISSNNRCRNRCNNRIDFGNE